MKTSYIIVLVFVAISLHPHVAAKTAKKRLQLKTTTTAPPGETSPQPAIIAIEIVDPNENSTSSKQSKRTIESALGYGYNSFEKPRYEIYKYSQHDIPPYQGDPSKIFSKTSEVKIEKAVDYSLPPVTEEVAHAAGSSLKPGTTLYSSLSAQGQIGGLTSSISNIPGLEQNQSPLPVVVLRIYPDQLKDSTIQANLPKSHPFAKAINSVNLQSLLLHYIKALQNPSPAGAESGYSAPVGSDYNSYHQQPSTQYLPATQYYQKQNNYYQGPSAAQYSGYSGNGIQIQQAPVKYQFRYQSSSIPRRHQTKKARPAQPQYYYVQPTTHSSYSTEQPYNHYYQPVSKQLGFSQQIDYNEQADYNKQVNYPQQVDYSTQVDYPQQVDYNKQVDYSQQDYSQQLPQTQQSGYEQQYQEQYYQQPYVDSKKLLTAENYPSDSHTRVVFKTDSGEVRTPETEQPPAKEIKTIKIQVPENVAKVEVEESEKPYYSAYQAPPGLTASQQNTLEQPYNSHNSADNYYPAQDSVKQDYYNTADSPATGSGFNYQNVDYDRMIKYFVRRGAMPKYFYQSPDDEEQVGEQKSTTIKEDVIAAYEDAAFPSTTQSSEEKKVKKKRT